MRFSKKNKLVAGCALLVTALTLLGIWYFRTPSREITRAELDQLVQAKTLTDGRVRPTPYAGIYHPHRGFGALVRWWRLLLQPTGTLTVFNAQAQRHGENSNPKGFNVNSRG